ncbi:MAG TPA: flagellin [Fibrobacteraceae bacterium]|nr:flagellin [Fibrobacteraceae bacterium]
MRINHNISAMITQTSLNNADSSMSKSLEKLSTGLRVNRASDDAAGLAVSERLRSQVKGMSRASMNAQDGVALLQIAEGACNEIDDILQRQRELAVQASSDTLTSTDRAYLDLEFTQLSEEIDRITKSTQYNTMTLLDGSGFGAGDAGSVLHIGANAGASDEINVHIGSVSTGSLGMSTSGANAVGVSTQSAATTAITSVDTAMNTVNELRANLGSYINRLEHTVNNLSNQEYNTEDAESRIRDVDFATETTEFTRNQILVQSSTSMLAQANSVPQTVLSLLG